MTMMMVCSTAVLHPMGSCCCRMPTSYWSNQPNSPFSWSCMQFHGAAVSARFARICLGLRRSHRSQRTCKSNHVEESVKKIGALRRRSVVHWVHCRLHPSSTKDHCSSIRGIGKGQSMTVQQTFGSSILVTLNFDAVLDSSSFKYKNTSSFQ